MKLQDQEDDSFLSPGGFSSFHGLRPPGDLVIGSLPLWSGSLVLGIFLDRQTSILLDLCTGRLLVSTSFSFLPVQKLFHSFANLNRGSGVLVSTVGKGATLSLMKRLMVYERKRKG